MIGEGLAEQGHTDLANTVREMTRDLIIRHAIKIPVMIFGEVFDNVDRVKFVCREVLLGERHMVPRILQPCRVLMATKARCLLKVRWNVPPSLRDMVCFSAESVKQNLVDKPAQPVGGSRYHLFLKDKVFSEPYS